MLFRYAADLVVLVHLAFVLFVLFGGMAVLRWPRVAWIHVPAAIWGVLIECFGWLCPLTTAENALRVAAGTRSYTGGFVERYVVALLYPPGLTPAIQLILAACVLTINSLIYSFIFVRRRV